MPIYEYECTKCNTVFEILVSINADENIRCEKCDSTETRKLISTSGVKISASPKNTGGCQPRGGFS